jgi:methionyl aminopeptidase
VIRDGFHGDTSRMYFVGNTPPRPRLTEACHEAMWRGIETVKPGAHLGDIGHAIQTFAESQRISRWCASIAGTASAACTTRIRRCCTTASPAPAWNCAGMTFTIEPMINAGKRDVRLLPDGWTVVTKDQSLSAQWEHTILVTDAGYEVLTLSATAALPAAAAAS